jgi:hypothetical protein
METYMKKIIKYGTSIIYLMGTVPSLAFAAEEIIRLETAKNTQGIAAVELQKRVENLEQTVLQLEQRVLLLESGKFSGETWVCTYKAMSETYTGRGASKAVASSKGFDACKEGQKGDPIFCKEMRCEQ